jgi:ArsR family transcriptional regulator, nickel/cobalt-responsive transcriptional repressor
MSLPIVSGQHPMKDAHDFDFCAARLKALADPERLRIVRELRKRPFFVGELAELLQVEIANLSHHLGVLRQEGLVETEKQGRFVLYRLHPSVFDATSPDSQQLDLGCCRLNFPSE